jgi:porin
MRRALSSIRFLFLGALAVSGWSARADDTTSYAVPLAALSELRSRLYADGVGFQFGYTPEIAYNVQGGGRHLTRNAEEFTLGASFNLEKLIALPNSTFQMTITERDGKNLSADAHLRTLQQVQEIYGGGQTWRWTQFWYDGIFFNHRLDLKLGRLGVGEDFMSFSCKFENLTFCGSLPGNIVSTWYNWPVSQWGARVKINLVRDWYIQAGAYQVNPSYLQTDNAFKPDDPSGRAGTLAPVELGWTPKFGRGELPGAYRVGVWYDDSSQPDVDQTPLVSSPGLKPLILHHENGYYAMMQQKITAVEGNSRRGLTLFANFVRASEDTAHIDQLVSLGLFYRGLFNTRPGDELGFGVGRTRVNSRLGLHLPEPVSLAHSEFPMELYYGVKAATWLTLRPNVQYIRNPGGFDYASCVVVIGLKANVNF